MVQVRVLGVALDAAGQHIVLLKPLLVEPGEGRVLPVWIGGQEATSILIAVEGQQAPRPLSHDLITTLFAAVGARVERVDVTRIEEGTFYAELTLATPTTDQVEGMNCIGPTARSNFVSSSYWPPSVSSMRWVLWEPSRAMP